jgi:hypothetical protein
MKDIEEEMVRQAAAAEGIDHEASLKAGKPVRVPLEQLDEAQPGDVVVLPDGGQPEREPGCHCTWKTTCHQCREKAETEAAFEQDGGDRPCDDCGVEEDRPGCREEVERGQLECNRGYLRWRSRQQPVVLIPETLVEAVGGPDAARKILEQHCSQGDGAQPDEISQEWRAWMRDAQQDLEVMGRVRDNLLKRLDDQRAEFSAKEAELRRLRERVRRLEGAGTSEHARKHSPLPGPAGPRNPPKVPGDKPRG